MHAQRRNIGAFGIIPSSSNARRHNGSPDNPATLQKQERRNGPGPDKTAKLSGRYRSSATPYRTRKLEGSSLGEH